MKIKGQQRQTLSAKESFYVGESVLNAFEAGKENAHSMDVLTSGEHKKGSDGSFYGYATIKHPRLGEFIVSFNTETGRARTNGFPWEFLSEEKYKLTNDQAAWVMAHQADLAEELNKDNPSFKFEEYKKPKPVSFNPYQPNISAGQELVFKEDIYYGDHETIADFVDIEIDPEEKLTREEARRIEDEATKLGFEFDEQENMFYFPEGTRATLVSQKGPGGWPVFKIGDVEYDFAGDPFLVQFANEEEEEADESVTDASKPANERIDKEDAIPDEDWVSRLNVIDVGNVESWPAEKIQAIFGDDAFWSDGEEDVLLGDEGWDGKVRRNGRVVGELNTETGKVELIKSATEAVKGEPFDINTADRQTLLKRRISLKNKLMRLEYTLRHGDGEEMDLRHGIRNAEREIDEITKKLQETDPKKDQKDLFEKIKSEIWQVLHDKRNNSQNSWWYTDSLDDEDWDKIYEIGKKYPESKSTFMRAKKEVLDKERYAD